MTSKTGIGVGRPFLVTTMLLRSPCRTRVRRLTLPFGRPFGLKSHGRGCWVRPRPLLKRLYSCIRRGFSTPKKSGDAKWCSLQTIWVRDEIYWRRSIHPKCATRRAPSLDRGSSAAGRLCYAERRDEPEEASAHMHKITVCYPRHSFQI